MGREALNRGGVGARSLNIELQAALNPKKLPLACSLLRRLDRIRRQLVEGPDDQRRQRAMVRSFLKF